MGPGTMRGPMSFAKTERNQLAELLLEVGPEAPTLCEGWNTRDLATHLYIRERRPLAAIGIFVKRARKFLEAEEARLASWSYEDLVRLWAIGPPSLFKPSDDTLNTAEHFIHHEDVRRGRDKVEPRQFSAVTNKELLKLAKRFGSVTLKGVAVPVILTPPDLPPAVIGEGVGVSKQGDNVVRVYGEPGELLLWAAGRSAVEVDVTGAVEALAGVDIKL